MLNQTAFAAFLALVMASFVGCSGMKVIHPNDPATQNAGTKMLDFSSGVPRIVSTYTCSMVAMNGTRVSAIAKSEAEARKETLAKCRGQTLVSICREENLKCAAN
jgi:hypothetical protein